MHQETLSGILFYEVIIMVELYVQAGNTLRVLSSTKVTHFEAPRNRQKGLRPSQTILLFQSHPRNSFSGSANLSPVSESTFKNLIEAVLHVLQKNKMQNQLFSLIVSF